MDDSRYLETRHGLPLDATQIDTLLGRLRAQATPRLILHAHGGLVGAAEGRREADVIEATFSTLAGWERGYFIWHTGIRDQILPGMREVGMDPVAARLLHHSRAWADERAAVGGNDASEEPDVAAPEEIRARLRERGEADADGHPLEEPIRAGLEARLSADPEFLALTAALALEARTAGSAGSWENLDIRIRRQMSPEMKETRVDAVRRALYAGVGEAALRIVLRFLAGRDHGLQATTFEEVARVFYLGVIGAAVWDRMKADAEAHFATPHGAGSRLLAGLEQLGKPVDLVVVGHSAGSILALHLLKAAKTIAPNTKVRLVFWAAAATQRLAAAIMTGADAVLPDKLALLSLTDRAEKHDALDGHVGGIYPRSLLYLVSGLLEPAYPLADAPLLGMERHREIGISRLVGMERDERRRTDDLLAKFKHAAWTCPCGQDCDSATHGSFSADRKAHLTTLRLIQTDFADAPRCPGTP